jgi:uncharacterized lipoprotein YajG
MKTNLIKLLLLLIGTVALVTGCQTPTDTANYLSPEFPPAQIVKETTP